MNQLNVHLVRSELGQVRLRAGFANATVAAKEIGISTMHLYNIERGRCGASTEVWEKMARLYNTPEAELRAINQRTQKELLERKLKNIA